MQLTDIVPNIESVVVGPEGVVDPWVPSTVSTHNVVGRDYRSDEGDAGDEKEKEEEVG